ncbi:MAG: hypothetical protein HRT73_16420 [Flavobacteriales bacterium]|nr:hypothetical protein [Flavobacteriales bacterium]
MRKKLEKERWKQNLLDESFEQIEFTELVVVSKKIDNCKFDNIIFKHSNLGSNTTYRNCKFINCSFSGKYCSLGNPVDYIDCTFENCNFTGTIIFLGSVFKRCLISGKMKNNILTDEKRWFKKYVKFEECNLTKVDIENMTRNGNKLFKDCELPQIF